MLTDKQVEQFQKLYQGHFGKEITKEEAQEKGIKIINLMRVVYSPLTEEDFEKLKKSENLININN